MQHRAPSPFRAFIPLAAIALLALSTGAGAAEEDDLVAIDKLTSEQITVVSKTGTDVVARIDKARKLIADANWTAARFEVGKARSELGKVREVSPSARIHDRIEAALHALRTSGKQQAQQQLLPIYQELDAQQEVLAVADTRTYVDKAKAKLAAGSQQEAEDALIEASASVDYFAIDLPVQETYSRLTSALIALRSKDLAQADSQLREAQRHIEIVVAAASESLEADEDVPAVSAE